MPFVKVVKNKAYFKRFQVKYRRRREGKTDYHARRHLVAQYKNKYNSPRYRLVVRFTNSQVICQIVYSEIDSDHVLAAAYSTELPRYGLNAGLKNYAAAYATGLLVARRVLRKLGLGELYAGNTDVNGEVVQTEHEGRDYYVAEVNDEKRPFRAALDVGINPTTTGHRVFAALKGAVDGGLDIPHNHKRFPGYDAHSKEYDASVHRDRIFGQHVANYMSLLKDEDSEKYKSQFAAYLKAGVAPEAVEDLYASVHEKIREDPTPKHSVSSKDRKAAAGPHDAKFALTKKRSLAQYKDRVRQKKASAKAKADE